MRRLDTNLAGDAVVNQGRETLSRLIDCSVIGQWSLGHFLMDEESAEIKFWHDRQGRVEDDLPDGDLSIPKKTRKNNWEEEHRSIFRAARIPYPPVYELYFRGAALQRVLALPERARQIVVWFDKTSTGSSDPSEEEVVDLGQNLWRAPRSRNSSTCILPNSVLWLRRRQRRIYPNECLHLQGIKLRSAQDLCAFNNAELMGLAGNAFSGSNVAALLLVCLAFLGAHTT